MIIKLLGHGAVVKAFLHLYHDTFADINFEVYSRSPQQDSGCRNVKFYSLEDYQPDGITFCCLSVNEESVLRQSTSFSKLTVAKPNLDLINQFIKQGYFHSGTHFIVTTPNELIAEAIIRQTNNLNVFALGLSIDAERYRNILPNFNINPDVTFDLLGNHYHSPIINFHDQRFHNDILIEDLMTALAYKIRSEFTGFRPPISSGVKVIYDAVYRLYHHLELTVSGYSHEFDTVTGGKFNLSTHYFYQPRANHAASTLLQDAIQTHKKTYATLTGERS